MPFSVFSMIFLFMFRIFDKSFVVKLCFMRSFFYKNPNGLVSASLVFEPSFVMRISCWGLKFVFMISTPCFD